MVFGRNMIPLEEVSTTRRATRTHSSSPCSAASSRARGCRSATSRSSAAPRRTSGSSRASSGRLDYIETITQWNARIGAPSLRKTLMKLRLLPRWLAQRRLPARFTSGVSANKVCFERELLDHYRLVFEKAA